MATVCYYHMDTILPFEMTYP